MFLPNCENEEECIEFRRIKTKVLGIGLALFMFVCLVICGMYYDRSNGAEQEEEKIKRYSIKRSKYTLLGEVDDEPVMEETDNY